MAETVISYCIGLTETVISDIAMATTNFKEFFLSLSATERQAFARKAGTTVGYLQTHIIYARKMPRRKLFDGLTQTCAKFSGPSKDKLLAFFYETKDAA